MSLSTSCQCRYRVHASRAQFVELSRLTFDVLQSSQVVAAGRVRPLVYVCAVDVTGSDDHIELIKAALLAMLEGLPQHASVMILTLAHDVGIVDMRESVPHFLHVSVGSDGFCDVALADVLPVVDMAVPVATHSACIAAAINAIFPSSFTNPHTKHSGSASLRAFGPAMAALMQLQVMPTTRAASNAPILIPSSPFQFPSTVLCVRILTFLSGPPNHGVGNTSLKSSASEYEKIAEGLATRHAVVDVFAIGTAEIGLESFVCLSSIGNGSIMIYPDLENASLPQDLFARVQRNHGFDCMLRLRCSRGFKVPVLPNLRPFFKPLTSLLSCRSLVLMVTFSLTASLKTCQLIPSTLSLSSPNEDVADIGWFLWIRRLASHLISTTLRQQAYPRTLTSTLLFKLFSRTHASSLTARVASLSVCARALKRSGLTSAGIHWR